MARRPQQPRPHIERVDPGQMIPQAQQDLLRRILGIGSIRHHRVSITINFIAMPLAQDFELKVTDHPFSGITNEPEELFQLFGKAKTSTPGGRGLTRIEPKCR